MSLKILCSGHLVRYPLGGHSWHHLQYLVGLQRMGHDVYFFEDYGWSDSCYDPQQNVMTSNPEYGVNYTNNLLKRYGLENNWCYLAEDGSSYGMSREQLAQLCHECHVYFNLSNINWIPELEYCQRRILVDTDPVFTQIGVFGMGGAFSRYHKLFTYGENVHKAGCEMPTGGERWLPTRQPVVIDLWRLEAGNQNNPFTTVMNWSNFGDKEYKGKTYGQKDREFEPFFSLPLEAGQPMEIAVNAPADKRKRLSEGGWKLQDPREITRDPLTYQNYLVNSRAEFCVAKHAYVSTQSGWFSDRSAAYLASGRPVIIQDTGFGDFLPCGEGLLSFRQPSEAFEAISNVTENYSVHCNAARAIAEEYFHSTKILSNLLEKSL